MKHIPGDTLPIGNMVVNRIADLRRVAGLRHRFDTEQPTLLDIELVNSRSSSKAQPSQVFNSNQLQAPQRPQFGLRWKMFELDSCEGNGRVCLVFPPKPDPPPMSENGGIQLDIVPPTPQVWFLDRAYDWHFIAPNFTTYFRLLLVHLGLPQWQLLHTPIGPTPWAKQIINLIAPHLLTDDEVTSFVDSLREDNEDFPVSTVDPSVFKSRSRTVRKIEEN